MKNAIELLSTYKSVHLNHANLLTHCGGIPLIITALFIALHAIAVPLGGVGSLPLAIPFIAVVLGYYCLIHWALFLGATLFTIVLYAVALAISRLGQPWWWAAGLFVTGWLLQFIGHYYERAKPAFFDDVKQLLIGPLFLVAELYFALGIQFVSRTEIEHLARSKRKHMAASNREATQK